MSNGPASDQSTDGSRFRIRPGAPNLPIPEPQRVLPKPGETPTAGYAIRPGAPEDSDHAAFLAMAEDKERADRRRRRRWTAGTALLAVCAVAAVLVSLSGGRAAGPKPKAAALAVPTTAAPTPTPTPAPTPGSGTTAEPPSAGAGPVSLVSLLSSAATDSAPLTVTTLFPGSTVSVDGRSYTRALTAASACGPTASAPLAAVLAKNGCRQLFRATYAAGTTAVTVGVAVFDSAAQAGAVKQQATAGNLDSLSGGATPVFCRGVTCRLSVNAIGRYAYFTVAGYTTGRPVPPSDTLALAAGTDMDAVVFTDLETRARAEAASG
jgi:hypothetical protein